MLISVADKNRDFRYTLCLKKTRQLCGKLQFRRKLGLILIILDKQHHHAFGNDTRIQLSLSLLSSFFLVSWLYLLLNRGCDRNDAKHNVSSSVDCWWLWKETVLVEQMFKVKLFHLHTCTTYLLSPLTNGFVDDVLWYVAHKSMSAASNRVISAAAV